MKTLYPLLMGAALIAVAPGLTRAQANPQTGKVIVLDNENTMTGDIERDGEYFRVRRLTGEVSVPASRVQQLCGSLKEAYLFLRRRAALNDPDERLRLAEWCRQHGLREEASEEVSAALIMRPSDPRLRRMLATLREGSQQPKAPATPPTPERTLPRVDVTSQTLNTFAVKIQPILMNACARCHCGNEGGNFHLKRAWSGGTSDRRALEYNIAAAVSQLNPLAPEQSPLLRKAISLHADNMTAAPLRNNQMAAFRTLEQWAYMAVAQNPGLKPSAPRPPASAVASTKPTGAETREEPSVFGEARPMVVPQPAVPAPGADEPGSPDAFNQENHGGQPPAGRAEAPTGRSPEKP